MLLVNVSGRFIIGITNIPDDGSATGIFDIQGDSEVSYIGFPDTPDVNIGVFDIQATSIVAYIGQAITQPEIVEGFFTILGNSALAYQGSNSADVNTGFFAIAGQSALAYIGQANQGGTIIREGSYIIAGNSTTFFIGKNGAETEGPNDYYEELIVRPDKYFNRSLRNQIEIDALTQGGDSVIVSSTAANPTVVRGARTKTTIVSSLDGVVTVVDPGIGLAKPPNQIEIFGHSLSALNGLKTVAQRISGTQYLISGISGSGTGGFAFLAGHTLYDQQFITISGHIAIPNGNYIVQYIDDFTFSLKTLAGANVGSTGGVSNGTIVGRYAEYFPGSGRPDPYADPQNACKLTIPYYPAGQKSRVNLNMSFPLTNLNGLLATTDTYICPNTITATSAGTGPGKAWRHRGTVHMEGPKFRWGRIGISNTFAGSPTRIRTSENHFFETGNSVNISGNNLITNGDYTATRLNDTEFTIPVSTGSNSSGQGGVRGTFEIGRLFFRIMVLGPPWRWNTCIEGDSKFFPGAEALEPYPVFSNVMNRWWTHFQPDLTGDDFQSWNDSIIATRGFASGHKVGKWNFSFSSNGSGVVTATCLEGPHGYIVGDKITIAGVSGINGQYLVATIPAAPTAFNAANGGFTGPTTFTVNGATPSVSGNGTAAVHYVKFSCFWADQVRDPVKVIDGLPMRFITNGYNLVRQEYDSSEDAPLVNRMDLYTRNFVALLNPTNVTLANTTLFRKPIV